MKSPYCYCSRCGDELRDPIREHYEDNHEGGPVLCLSCIQDVFQAIPDALQSAAEAFNEALTTAFRDALREAFTDNDADDAEVEG